MTFINIEQVIIDLGDITHIALEAIQSIDPKIAVGVLTAAAIIRWAARYIIKFYRDVTSIGR